MELLSLDLFIGKLLLNDDLRLSQVSDGIRAYNGILFRTKGVTSTLPLSIALVPTGTALGISFILTCLGLLLCILHQVKVHNSGAIFLVPPGSCRARWVALVWVGKDVALQIH